MSIDPSGVSTVTFDSYSTIVDVDTTTGPLAEYADKPDRVAATWRLVSLMFTMAANDVDAYQPFYEMNRDALAYALEAHGIDVDAETREEILGVYMDLDVFDDVRGGMEQLGREYDLWVVSNGNPEMLDRMIELAGIGDLLEGYVSADEVETFKPDPGIYEHAADRVGTPVDEIAHVSAGWFDVQGAAAAGMQGIWVDRKGAPWPRFDGVPDLRVESFFEFAEELGV